MSIIYQVDGLLGEMAGPVHRGRSDRLAGHRGRYRYSVDGVAALSQHPQADLAARGCEVRPPCARTPAGALRIVDLEAQEQA